MWAMMQKLRMCFGSGMAAILSNSPSPVDAASCNHPTLVALTLFGEPPRVSLLMSARNRITYFVVIAWMLAGSARADEPSPPPSPPSASAPAVLLFRSGRTARGQIKQTDTHYVVERPVGKIEVPKADVEAVFRELDEVYRYKAKKIDDADPEAHRRLADWCLLENLLDRAVQELERAASLSPDPKRYEALLQGVRRSIESANAAPTPRASDPPVAPAFRPEGSARLTGRALSPELVSRFTIQVQPILARSCGTAGCHDASRRGGLVVRRSSRPSPRTTQQNLDSVLAHVDVENFELSPVLTFAARAHGQAARSPLARGAEDPALATLHDWLRDAVGNAAKQTLATESAAPPADGFLQNPDVISSKPVRPTPSRIRSRMVVPAGAVASTTSPAAAPHAVSQPAAAEKPTTETAPAQSTAIHGATNQPVAPADQSARESVSRPPTETEKVESRGSTTSRKGSESSSSSMPATGETGGARGSAPLKPQPDRRAPAASTRSVDPFDPEIFNRQFSPRPAETGP